MSLQIVPLQYTEGQEGDFQWMINSGLYPNSLYVFPESLDMCYLLTAGPQNQSVRPYNLYGLYSAQPMSAGICITSDAFGPYQSLSDVGVQNNIDRFLLQLTWAISFSAATTLYFSSNPSPTGGFPPVFDNNGLAVGQEVIDYITTNLYSLGTF